MKEQIIEIASKFDIDGEIIDIKYNNSGNINKTYVITYKMSNDEVRQYIFQKINTTVFKEPYKVMKNIENITNWIEKNSDDSHPYLKITYTKEKSPLAVIIGKTGEKQYYRAYNYIENSISYDKTFDSNIVREAGKAFGHFQKMLIDYPVKSIKETIPDFHNTLKRYEDFLNDVRLDVCGRAIEVSKEIVFAIKNSNCVSNIIDLLDNGIIPTRIIHNDTKVNNVMMDKDTGDYLTVIDLDTVMTGSSLYDYGDGVRSTAANSLEDEVNLDNVYINLDLFESYTDGYLSEMAPFLTEIEVKNMGRAIETITFELGLRFLNDYINGDTYFKTTYDKHNLVRARNQFKLLSDIKQKMPYINEYTYDTYQKYNQKTKVIK